MNKIIDEAGKRNEITSTKGTLKMIQPLYNVSSGTGKQGKQSKKTTKKGKTQQCVQQTQQRVQQAQLIVQPSPHSSITLDASADLSFRYPTSPVTNNCTLPHQELKKTDEVEVCTAALSFHDRRIGSLSNRTGYLMATVDVIIVDSGEHFTLLDVESGSKDEKAIDVFKIINANRDKVSAIFINIVKRCELIVQELIRASSESDLEIPIVVKLQGANVEDAKALIATSQLRILPCDNLDEAAKMLANIINVAHSTNVDVKFEPSI